MPEAFTIDSLILFDFQWSSSWASIWRRLHKSMANRITSASRSIKILSRFAQPSNALFNGWFGGASDGWESPWEEYRQSPRRGLRNPLTRYLTAGLAELLMVGRVHEKSIDNPQEEILRLVGRLWAERSAHESAGYLSTRPPIKPSRSLGCSDNPWSKSYHMPSKLLLENSWRPVSPYHHGAPRPKAQGPGKTSHLFVRIRLRGSIRSLW